MVGPFVLFIENLVKGLPKDAVGLVLFSLRRYGSMATELPTILYKRVQAFSRDDDQGEDLLNYIHIGAIDYSKCLRVKRDNDESNYRQWISDRAGPH